MPWRQPRHRTAHRGPCHGERTRSRCCVRLRPELRQRKVVTLALFGSVARDEAGPDSDVDVLVGTQRPFSLFDFVGVNRHLEAALGRPVDVVHEDKLEPLAPMDALHPPMREGLLRDLVRVF